MGLSYFYTGGAESLVDASDDSTVIDDASLYAFFDDCRGPIYRHGVRRCSVEGCNVRLSGYNRGSTCFAHTPDKHYRAIVTDKKPIREKYHGRPCRVCGGTQRYAAGNCVACAKIKADIQTANNRKKREALAAG